MQTNPTIETQPGMVNAAAVPRYRGAIWTLLLLAPVIAEVLSGSTRLSFIFVLAPEVMVWGVGALLGRELVQRWKGGGPSLLMMGLALSVAEEFIIQQTSIAPLPFLGADAALDRLWGVNWLYLLFMLGFESVFVVMVPVQVTELIFPEHSRKGWLRRRGAIASCIVFVVGAWLAWFGWTQQARPRLHAAPYHPPLALLATGMAAILLLIAAAYALRGYGHARQIKTRRAMNLWLVGIAAFIFSGAWFELITLVFVPRPGIPHWLPMVGGVTWAVLAFALFRYWAAAGDWSERHRWAVSLGGTMAIMSVGYLSFAGWTKMDIIGKAVFNVLTTIGFLVLGRAVWKRRQGSGIEP